MLQLSTKWYLWVFEFNAKWSQKMADYDQQDLKLFQQNLSAILKKELSEDQIKTTLAMVAALQSVGATPVEDEQIFSPATQMFVAATVQYWNGNS